MYLSPVANFALRIVGFVAWLFPNLWHSRSFDLSLKRTLNPSELMAGLRI